MFELKTMKEKGGEELLNFRIIKTKKQKELYTHRVTNPMKERERVRIELK